MKITTPMIAACISCATLYTGLAAAHSYDYFEGGFVSRDARLNQDSSGRHNDGGLRVAGSVSILPDFALFGEFADTGNLEQGSIGGQFHTNLQPRLDWTLGASIVFTDGERDDDTGLGLRTGFRWMNLDQRFEVSPEIRYFEAFGEGYTSLRVAGLYRVTQPVQLQLAVQGGDDDRIEAGARYNF